MGVLKKLGDVITLSQEAYTLDDILTTFNTLEAARGKSKSPMYRFEYEGTGESKVICEELFKILGDPILLQEDPGDKTYWREYVNGSSYVRLYLSEDKECHIQIRGATTDADIYNQIKKLSIQFIETKKPTNAVFALMSGPGGLSLRSIGRIEHDLVSDNYTKDAVKGYEHIVNCLSSSDPCGRLILLQGPPGTGKSYMIRSLVSNINSIFIVVGAHMIAELSGPSILPVILGCVDSDDKKPITFILEDSDIALSHRKHGGVAELSGLLNLGDGLLGELLDIRILATTNAELLDLDPAIVRPGRMCQHIKLNPFNVKEATELYSSMVKGKTVTVRKETTLAEIYRMARADGWSPDKKDKPSDGQYL